MIRPLVALAVVASFALNASGALTELRFSEAQMPLGTSASIVHLAGGEYTAYGITTVNAYRYNDDRDPFSDGAENYLGTNPWGLSMDGSGSIARINLLSPTTSLQVDWFALPGNTFFLDVYNTSGIDIHPFSGSGSGTEVINAANISYLTWHDSGGYVQISNLRFATVPEPGVISLAVTGLFVAGLRFRKQGR